MRNQSGFTLIELVLVIIILGILAAVAVPRFINLSSEAQTAALQGTVGAINSASAINFAAYQVAPANAVQITAGTTTCTSAINGTGTPPKGLLQPPLDLSKYTIGTGTITSGLTEGSVYSGCTISTKSTPAQTATVTLLVTN